MRKLVYYVAVTLDGYIAGPQGEHDFFPIPEDLTAAISEELPETIPTPARAHFGIPDAPNKRFDTVVMGRGTYGIGLSEGVTSPYAHLRQYVVSTTLTTEEPAVRIVSDEDPVALVRRLKAEEGGMDIWLCGGGKLAGAVLDEIDELVIKRSPRIAGAGIPMFDGEFRPTAFAPVSPTRDFPSGISLTTYARQ
ncbi:dihydrofolate reductase family protein [Streptomyces iconiensis]|uniref:Dihydrofolate reductase family protein n=1 Tax=Streptomyces iconiensis TaxID=1384038 RepID=A0ABT7AAM7_9ACTN|nr:dihydrofolate reductase family protein [Streptomyces iconiensis]MDJ1138102.1 dihydrofolate reductase family protein [Streptomyces iconiensis]